MLGDIVLRLNGLRKQCFLSLNEVNQDGAMLGSEKKRCYNLPLDGSVVVNAESSQPKIRLPVCDTRGLC
jgi:hypothetical protein